MIDIKLYGPLLDFCIAAYNENEKRIVRARRRGNVPTYLLDNQKLLSIKKWTIMETSLLNRVFISKEFDDNLLLGWKGERIESVSIMHKLTDKVVACESYFSLSRIGFPVIFKAHEAWTREKKAKLLIYPFEGNADLVSKYLNRKGNVSMKKLKKYENVIEMKGSFMNIFYLKIAKKESFMTLMKEIL